jgi:hypothetical protein
MMMMMIIIIMMMYTLVMVIYPTHYSRVHSSYCMYQTLTQAHT